MIEVFHIKSTGDLEQVLKKLEGQMMVNPATALPAIQEVCAYAKAHPLRAAASGMVEMPSEDPRHVVDIGPLRCTFAHAESVRSDTKLARVLLIGYSDPNLNVRKNMPPPSVAGAIASLFGFQGEPLRDYAAALIEAEVCMCGECPAGVLCLQPVGLVN